MLPCGCDNLRESHSAVNRQGGSRQDTLPDAGLGGLHGGERLLAGFALEQFVWLRGADFLEDPGFAQERSQLKFGLSFVQRDKRLAVFVLSDQAAAGGGQDVGTSSGGQRAGRIL